VLDVLPGGATLSTVEGNTDPGGSREGDGVYQRTRRIDEIELYLDFSRYLPPALTD
jgi:hypothetical protein